MCGGFDKLKKECIDHSLCVECGACAAVCPEKAIDIRHYSWGNNPELCKDCSNSDCDLCCRVCPGRTQPIGEIESRFFGRKANAVERKLDIGVVRSFYTGFTTQERILEGAVSGGVTTSILVNAFEQGEIDGAVLASFDPEKPWVGKAKVCTTKEEIINCAGSCYQPHPQLLGIREAVATGLKKFAVTATPCAAVALRKMMLDPEFADIGSKIKLIISNFCAAHWSRWGTEWLIQEQMKLRLEDVAGLSYRARPFPGMFKVTLKDGTVREEKFVYGYLKHMGRFTPEECRYCLDKIGFAADIAVGDTWGHPAKSPSRYVFGLTEEDKRHPFHSKACNGISQFLVRSELGQKLVDSAIANKYLTVEKESEEMKNQVLDDVQTDKRTTNGQIVEARISRGIPVHEYIKD